MVGRIREAGSRTSARVGDRVFVPGARCYGEIRGLFGGAASRVVIAGDKAIPLHAGLGEEGVLLALAATAHHAVICENRPLPELIIGHGVLGRLLARIVVALGAPPPVVWETNPQRCSGADGYTVMAPGDDQTKAYASICDVSGDSRLLDTLIGRLAPGGEIILAGFYSEPLSFAFPPAFMREARLRVAAEWKPADLAAVGHLIESGRLSLSGLITHRLPATSASSAYRTAFTDPECLKMILDWRSCS